MRHFLSFVKASTVGLAFAGSGHARRRMIMVPGAYFRDETIWRGRMIEFACDLKATLYELGFWAGVMYVAAFLQLEGLSVAVGVGVCIKMLFGYRQEMRGGKRAEREIGRYVNEAYRS